MANENKKATFREKVENFVNSKTFSTISNIVYGVGAASIVVTLTVVGYRAIKNKGVNDFLNRTYERCKNSVKPVIMRNGDGIRALQISIPKTES